MDEKKLQKRKEKAINDKNKNLLISVLSDLASAYFQHGKYYSAIQEYELMAKTYNELGQNMNYAVAHRMIGEVYSTGLSEFDKALKHQQIHLNVARKERNSLEEQRALATIGRTYLFSASVDQENIDQNKLSEAEKAFMKSLTVCESLKNINKQEQMDMRARLYMNLGIIHEDKECFDEAIKYIEKAIQIFKTYDIHDQLYKCYYTLGLIYLKLQNYGEAIQYINFALEVAKRLPDKITLMCEALMSKFEVLVNLADFVGAKQVIMKAYKLKTPNQDDYQNIVNKLKIVAALCYAEDALFTTPSDDFAKKKKLYEKMGDGACELKNFNKAIDYYKKMLECAELNGDSGKALSLSYISLAQTYKDNKQYDLALNYFQKDYDLFKNNKKESYSTLLNIADVLELMNSSYEDIEIYYMKAREAAEEIGDEKLVNKAILRLLAIQRKMGKNHLADALEQENPMMALSMLNSETESEEMTETSNFADDINISDITDISDDSDNEQMNRPRRRGKCLTIKKNAKGETQLHLACISGNLTLVQKLLDQGHTVNVRDNAGWLPIHEAAIGGYKEIIEALIKKGAAVNDRGGTFCNGMTPLHDAASNGHLEVIEVLLDNGAIPTVQTDDGLTVLDILHNWRNTADIDDNTNSFYNSICAQLQTALDKVGHKNMNKMLSNSSEKKNRLGRKRSVNEYETDDDRFFQSEHRRNLDLDDSSNDSYASTSMSTSNKRKEFKGAKEYQKVMANIRKRVPTQCGSLKKTPVKKSALVNESDENWLEIDVDIINKEKRRKLDGFSSSFTNKTFDKSKHTSNESLNSGFSDKIPLSLNNKKSPRKSDPEVIKNLCDFDEIPSKRTSQTISLDDESSNDSITTSISFSRSSSFNSNSSHKPRKHQLSLIDAGFSRERSSTPLSQRNTSSRTSNTQFQQDTISPSSNTQINLVGINIRIENKMWKIPIPSSNINNLTIEWLAKEAANRYYSKEGIRPVLQLETVDGAILDDNDPVSLIVHDKELKSQVLSWNLPSLSERYLDVCKTKKNYENQSILKQLDKCQATRILSLNDLGLNDDEIIPVLKALNHQYSLKEFNISGNRLTDECIKYLCESLLTMKHLEVLDLSLNLITSKGLSLIAEMFLNATEHILPELRCLNLRFTVLEETAIRHLSIITKNLQLKALLLGFSEITSKSVTNLYENNRLNLQHLEEIDLEGNNIRKENLQCILNEINQQNLKKINLRGVTASDGGAAKELAALIARGNPQNLLDINLSQCKVTDYEVFDLLRCLSKSEKIHTLDLSFNEDLTFLSLRQLLEHKPPIQNLIINGCKNITNNIEESISYIETGVKTLKITITNKENTKILTSFWENFWRIHSQIREGINGYIELKAVI